MVSTDIRWLLLLKHNVIFVKSEKFVTKNRTKNLPLQNFRNTQATYKGKFC